MYVSIYICKDWEMYSYIVVDVKNKKKRNQKKEKAHAHWDNT